MNLNVNPVWLLAFLLAFVRSLAWLTVAPPFSNRRLVPAPVLMATAVGLAILAAPRVEHTAIPTSTAGLIGSVVTQVATGVALGLSLQMLLAAVTSAGAMVDLFGGINLPPAIDPLSENQTPLFGQLYEQFAMVLLFVTNGEMLVVHGFETSFDAPGLTLSASTQVTGVLTSDLATFFVATLQIAAPIIVVLFATQVALALLARAAPQVNVWVLGFPIQAILSIAFVAIGIKVLPGSVANLVDRNLQDIPAMLTGR